MLVDGLVDGSQFPLLQLTLTGWVPQPPPHEPEQLPYADADHVPVYVGAHALLFTHDVLVAGFVDGSQFPLLHVTLRDCVPEPPPHEPEQLPYADVDHVPSYTFLDTTFVRLKEPSLHVAVAVVC